MSELKLAAVSFGDVTVPLPDWLAHLHRRGRLIPLLREAAVEEFLCSQAAKAGLSVSTEELQQSANAFRQRNRLASAADTRAWLAGQKLEVADLEQALERDVLIDKFKDHQTRAKVAGHFEAHHRDYDRAQMRLIVVQREDLARELLSQIRDEEADFGALARAHSLHPSRGNEGRLGLMLRRDLPPAAADAIFAGKEGALAGPIAMPQGFALFLVEKILPATLDADLTARLRQELFDRWLTQQFATAELQVPLLEGI